MTTDELEDIKEPHGELEDIKGRCRELEDIKEHHDRVLEELRTACRRVVSKRWQNGGEDALDYDQLRIAHENIEACTLSQLWSLWWCFLSKDAPIGFYPCNPKDHMAVQSCGMYIGIEPDGYTHS